MENNQQGFFCSPDEAGHCITCSDEALPGRVLKVENERSMALVAVGDAAAPSVTEVDISLVEPVECGEILLVHGGVALDRLTTITGQ